MYQIYDHAYSQDEKSITVFGTVLTTSVNTWFPFSFPSSCTMAHIIMGGGGGGGGGGAGETTTSAAGGGGGGGSGGFSTLIIPIRCLPKTVYLSPGSGSTGGTGGNNSTSKNGGSSNNGGQSYVSCVNGSTGVADVVLTALQGQGGGGGTTSGGFGGSVGNSISMTSCYAAIGGLFNSAASGTQSASAGASGGAASAGGGITWQTSIVGNTTAAPFTCGMGGGGCNAGTTPSAGGTFTGKNGIPSQAGGAAGGGNGLDGLNMIIQDGLFIFPMFSTSGSGGGGNTGAALGGNGGHGGPCSGGSGGGGTNGGSGSSGIIGGRGGNGGPGFIYIVCW